MRKLGVVLVCVCIFAQWAAVAQEQGFKGGGQATEDFASFNIKNIGLVVTGTWKGSEAKVEPTMIATPIKARLREKGYEIMDVLDKKQLKLAEQGQDAILTIKYEAQVRGKAGFIDGSSNKVEEVVDRMIRGTAELKTTKKVGKKPKVIFRAKGETGNQVAGAGDGEHLLVNPNAPLMFSAIVGDIPPVPGAAAKGEAPGEEKKEEKKEEKPEEKKDEKKEKGEKDK
ncbi:MAG: hypothetical protein AB1696_08195 [Planctomycetota bacterium]